MKKKPELIVFALDGAVTDLILKLVEEKELPHFARLLQKGLLFRDLRPPHPTITPVCWSSFATGATPECHGIVSDILLLDPDLSKPSSAYYGEYLRGERFWEGAAKNGKKVLIDSLPVSGPARSEAIRQVEGSSCFPARKTRPGSDREFFDVPQQLWFFDLAGAPVEKLSFSGLLSAPVKDLGNGRFQLILKEDPAYPLARELSWEVQKEEGGFVFLEEGKKLSPDANGIFPGVFRKCAGHDGGEKTLGFIPGCFRVSDGYILYTSSSSDIRDSITPPDFRKLLPKLPPPPGGHEYIFLAFKETAQAGLALWQKDMDWHKELIREARKQEDLDVIVTYATDPDTLNHLFYRVLSGAIPAEKEHFDFVRDLFKSVYKMADDFLGFLLEEVAGEETLLLTLSDHGSMGIREVLDVNDILAEGGFLFWQEDTKSKGIDWQKTRAACCGYGHIFVNLAARNTHGIVPMDEYEKTRSGIIALLQEKMRDEEGAPFLAFAVRGEEAGFFGLGGDRCGDVVYGLSAGNARTVHAEQIPTAQDATGSMRALGILAGPGVPENTRWESPATLMDLAPTLCHLLGYPLPKGHTGRILPFTNHET